MQITLLRACEKFLPAIVRLLLPNGINCREFVDMAKRAYVKVVTEEHGLDGRPANISKTSVLTGLTRPEISRIRSQMADGVEHDHQDQRRYNLTELLLDWHNDKDWCDREGKPVELSLSGPEKSFEALVQRHFGNVPITAVLRELRAAGAVEMSNDNKVKVLRAYYRPTAMSVDHAQRVGQLVSDFISTIHVNLYTEAKEESRVEYRTLNTNIPVRHLPVFKSMLNSETQELCARIDRWLDDKERFETQEGEPTTRMGFGVYQIGEEQPPPTDLST